MRTVCHQVQIPSHSNQMYDCHNNWNWSTKSLSSPSYWFYFLNPSISSLLCCLLDRYWLKTLTEDFLNFLRSISSVSLSSANLSSVYAFCTLCLSSFLHDDCASVMLCLHLSTYSAASSSSLRNFLTLKFLSEEYIKIAYSPPCS